MTGSASNKILALEERLSEERAYSKMLELDIAARVREETDKQLKNEYERGKSNGVNIGREYRDNATIDELVRAIQHELERTLPDIFDEALPKELEFLTMDQTYRIQVSDDTLPSDDKTVRSILIRLQPLEMYYRMRG